jgi:hypothetical protein
LAATYPKGIPAPDVRGRTYFRRNQPPFTNRIIAGAAGGFLEGATTMGMDVYGKQPTSEVGEYFRANIWSWRPIYSLVLQLCEDLLDDETLRLMAQNDGAGPSDAATCNKMADRFEQWLKTNRDGHTVYVEREAAYESGVLSALEGLGATVANDPTYDVSAEHLAEWVLFLRHCGGFEVW